MDGGIAIVGANGSGKTTLGKYLAGLLGYRHMDAEDYYFADAAVPYAHPRTKEEVQELLAADIKKHRQFILSSVNGDFGGEINAKYALVVYIHAPLEVRLARVRQRAVDRFGSRVLEGGDLFEQEEAFFRFVAGRTMEKTTAWVRGLSCPVLHADGREPPEATARRIVSWMNGER